jgi:hypothetical protein
MTPNREHNWCCGGGGGLANFDSAEGVKKRETTFEEYRMKIAGKKKLEQILATRATYVASPCANCKRQITQLMEYHKTGVQVGGVFDLLNRAIILDKSHRPRIVPPQTEFEKTDVSAPSLKEADPSPAKPTGSSLSVVQLSQVKPESADLSRGIMEKKAPEAVELKGVGLCAVYSQQGEWAFDYALSLARRNKARLNIYQFLESPYTFQRDVVFVDAAKTKTAPVTPELIAEKDKELRFWYDERLGGYVNVGFRLCEGNDDWEVKKCFKRGDYEVLVIGYQGPGTPFGGATTIEKFARRFRGAVVLVGPDDPHSFYVNKQAEEMLGRLNIPKDRWRPLD